MSVTSKSNRHVDLELISEYYEYQKNEADPYHIGDKVANDLDLDHFFRLVDRTTSAVGQQYLYKILRNAHATPAGMECLEADILQFDNEPLKRDKAVAALGQLNKPHDYYFPFLIFGKLPPEQEKITWIKILGLANLASLLMAFLYPMFFLLFVALYAVSLYLHYQQKQNYGNFARVFYRLSRITNVASTLHKSENGKSADLTKSLSSVNTLLTSLRLLKTDQLQENEITSIVWFAIELIKILTLAELLTFDKVIRKIPAIREDINKVYQYVGRMDLANSIYNLRKELPHYSKPSFTHTPKEFLVENLYHPGIENCVANSLHLNGKNLLLTGSNMSGKSSFLKAVNLNIIASQVLNTSFTTHYAAPILAVDTSMNINEQIQESKSYYMEEVNRIKSIVEKSEQQDVLYLFTIDEIFKGTNAVERISASTQVLSYIASNQHLVFVSTHDKELCDLISDDFELHYFEESVESDALTFDFKIKKGISHNRNAIDILELSGYPIEIISKSRLLADQILKNRKSD